MKMIPTISFSLPAVSSSVLSTSDFLLEIGHHRRSGHAYPTHPEITP